MRSPTQKCEHGTGRPCCHVNTTSTRRTGSTTCATWPGLEKKFWWMIPMVLVFVGLGALIVMTQGSALSPFIYALF